MEKICFIEGCLKPKSRLNMCYMHYMRFHKHGDASYKHSSFEQQIIRFWQKVAITSDINKCWVWLKSVDKDGYGRANVTRNKKNVEVCSQIFIFNQFQHKPTAIKGLPHLRQSALCQSAPFISWHYQRQFQRYGSKRTLAFRAKKPARKVDFRASGNYQNQSCGRRKLRQFGA